MATGQVTVFSDGVNLDNCLKQGLTITGNARCPYCKQVFSYQVHLFKRVDTGIAGEGNRSTDDTYDICIDFSGDSARFGAGQLVPQVIDSDADEICVPCRGCNPRCPKLLRR